MGSDARMMHGYAHKGTGGLLELLSQLKKREEKGEKTKENKRKSMILNQTNTADQVKV